MGFTNSVLGGGGTLVRKIAKSVNYVTNTSGWAITKDGLAEFYSAVLRGSLRVPGSDGSEVAIYAGGGGGSGIIAVSPPTPVNGVDIGSATISTASIPNGPGAAIGLTNFIGSGAGGFSGPTLAMSGGSDAVTQIDMTADNINANPRGMVGTTSAWNLTAPYTVYTPVVGNAGTATYTVRTGAWKRIAGQLIHVIVDIVVNAAGSGATPITITMPTTIDKSYRQPIGPIYFSGAANGVGVGLFPAGANSNVITNVRVQQGGAVDNVTDITGAGLRAGAQLGINAFYKEP